MFFHHFAVLILGITLAYLTWSRKAGWPAVKHPDSFAFYFLAIFLVSKGALPLLDTIATFPVIGEQIGAIALLFIPSALVYTRGDLQFRVSPIRNVFIIALPIMLTAMIIISPIGIPGNDKLPGIAAAGAMIYLTGAMFLVRGLRKMLLGLSAIIWGVYFAQAESHYISGTGIIMAALAFYIRGESKEQGCFEGLGFDSRDFVYALECPYFITDLAGKIIFASREFLHVSGYQSSEILHQDAIRYVEIPSSWRLNLIPSENGKKIRCSLIAKNGEKFPVDIHISEINKYGRGLKSLLCLVSDEREMEILENQVSTEAKTFASLYETSKALSSSLELKVVLESIGNAAENLIGANSCIIFALDESSHKIKPLYSTQYAYNAEIMGLEIEIGQGLTGIVIRDGKPMIQNFDDDLRVAMQIPGTPEEEEESLLSVPLITKSRVLGAITLYKTRKNKFHNEELKVLTIFASQAASVLESSRLYMKLKRSEKAYRASVDQLGDAIFYLANDSGKITDVNETARRLFKLTNPEFVSNHIWEMCPPSEMHLAKAVWQEVKKSGGCKPTELPYLTKDGIVIPCLVSATTIATGDICFIQWICQDIGEYKKIIKNADFFRKILERIEIPVLVTDSNGVVRFSNAAFQSAFEIHVDLTNALGPKSSILEIKQLEGIYNRLKNKNSITEEMSLPQRNSKLTHWIISIHPIFASGGNLKYHVWVFIPHPREIMRTQPQAQAKVLN